ncbi:DUF429 domain-containing protein [Candidatus Microgenomates bacterium]|nr:DUF429 domain-containing protein [Candidatus Microgenomates bacterium]
MSKTILVCGIDLGGKLQKTTGVCFLKIVNGSPQIDPQHCRNCIVVKGEDLISYLEPYLKQIKVIAIDAPLTLGPGKGKMRLWEKFFSTKPFRQYQVNPVPPAAIWRLSYHGMEVVSRIASYGFFLNENLIETFPTFAKVVLKDAEEISCKNQNERDAYVCAQIAAHHFMKKTFWLGYRDGKLFLPSFEFWKREWAKRFQKYWREKDRFRYKFLSIG